MSLFKEILFHDIESNLRDFAVQPKSFEENKQILQKYYEDGGPMKANSWLSFTFSQMNYENKCIYSDISKKYTLLKKSLNNKFSPNDSNDYLNSFSRAQKIYFAFSRLAFVYRYKKAIIRNEEDMFMLPISETEKKVITVYENNNKYLFRHSEILKICQNSLCSASENDLDYIEPRPMKNPYTNIPFNKASLFYMYDKIAKESYKVPLLFQTFFLCSFNLKELWVKHSPFITSLTIKDYINNAPPKTITGIILAMLEHVEQQHDIDFKFSISSEFNRDTLNTVMKPYLELFLQSFHNHNDFFSNRCLEELKYKLKVLHTKHPNFGRKKISLTRNYVSMKLFNVKRNVSFSSEHNDFKYSTALENFKESHSYIGFIDDIDFRLDDPYFARERRQRLILEQNMNQPLNFSRRRQNGRNTILNTFQYHHNNNNETPQPIAYYDDDDDEDNVSNTTTTISSNEGNSQSDNMVGLYNELNTNETDNLESTYEEEDLFDENDSISTINLSGTVNDTEIIDENKTTQDSEEGEIPRVETPPYFQELQNISTQVRSLLNDEDILVIDGRERLLSLLSQIDNLHSA